MSKRPILRIASLFVVLALIGIAAPAYAANPTKAQCIAANEKADSQRKSGSLRAARASYLVCANPTCPKLVRDDCNKSIPDIESAIPTVTFTAKNGGDDTTDVAIAMDGEAIAKQADGKPISVDPGEHLFVFTTTGFPPQSSKVVIREGEKNRHIDIQFGDAPKPDAPSGRLVITSDTAATISVDGRSSAIGRFDGNVAAGSHDVRISENGKITQTRIIEVKGSETTTLNIALESEKKSLTPWLIGGAAVVVTAGLVVGGIVLFSKSDNKTAIPQGSVGGVGLATFR